MKIVKNTLIMIFFCSVFGLGRDDIEFLEILELFSKFSQKGLKMTINLKLLEAILETLKNCTKR